MAPLSLSSINEHAKKRICSSNIKRTSDLFSFFLSLNRHLCAPENTSVGLPTEYEIIASDQS